MRAFKYIGFGILAVGLVILAVWLTMSLWNWLVPELFHGPIITFWQTAGLFLLSKILLTGISPRSHRYSHRDHYWHKKYHGRYHCRENENEATPEVKPES